MNAHRRSWPTEDVPLLPPWGPTLLLRRRSRQQTAVHTHSAFEPFCPCRMLMQMDLTQTLSSSLPAVLPCLLVVSRILPGLLTFIFCVCLNNSQVETSVKYLPRCQDGQHLLPLPSPPIAVSVFAAASRSVLWLVSIHLRGWDGAI